MELVGGISSLLPVQHLIVNDRKLVGVTLQIRAGVKPLRSGSAHARKLVGKTP